MEKTNDSPIVLNLDSVKCPEVKDYKVGQKVTLTIEAEVQSISKGSLWEYERTPDKKIRATLKVTKVLPEEADDEATMAAKKGYK